jgi:hypothetical protein
MEAPMSNPSATLHGADLGRAQPDPGLRPTARGFYTTADYQPIEQAATRVAAPSTTSSPR